MKLQLKRSNVLDGGLAKEPTAGQLEYGELAVNYNANDPVIFIKDSDNSIIRISTKGIPLEGDDQPQSGTLDDRYVMLNGSTMTGALILDADPTENLGAATKQYVDNSTPNVPDTNLAWSGQTGTIGKVTSSTGTDATLTSATTTAAGLLSATDKVKVDASLTETDADALYLTLTDADSVYLKKTDAGSLYLTLTDADSLYLKKTDADSLYLTLTDADSVYLKKTDADSTYVKADFASLPLLP